jgi:hypothetical protein
LFYPQGTPLKGGLYAAFPINSIRGALRYFGGSMDLLLDEYVAFSASISC